MIKVLIISIMFLFFNQNSLAWTEILDNEPIELKNVKEKKIKLIKSSYRSIIGKFNLSCDEKFDLKICNDSVSVFYFNINDKNFIKEVYLIEIFINNKFKEEFFDSNSNFHKIFMKLLEDNKVDSVEVKKYLLDLLVDINSKKIISNKEYIFSNGVAVNFYDTASYTGNLHNGDYKFYIYMKVK